MPVFPAALLAAAVWADRLLQSRRTLPRAAVAVLLAALAASSLAFRFGGRHGKENYRHAVSLAAEALRKGQCVWWTGDTLTVAIYDPSVARNDRFVSCSPLDADQLRAAPPPDLLFFNRPDTWDVRGVVGDYIASHPLRLVDEFHGFRVYRPDVAIPLPAPAESPPAD